MIVKYDKFLSKIPDEVTEVEVDDELGKEIAEMDEAAAKIDRKETRRHTYMSELEEKRKYIPDDSDPLEDILEDELHKELRLAIETLSSEQRELLIRVYWNNELQKDIAAEKGVSEMAISKRMKRIIKKLKNFFE